MNLTNIKLDNESSYIIEYKLRVNIAVIAVLIEEFHKCCRTGSFKGHPVDFY